MMVTETEKKLINALFMLEMAFTPDESKDAAFVWNERDLLWAAHEWVQAAWGEMRGHGDGPPVSERTIKLLKDIEAATDVEIVLQ